MLAILAVVLFVLAGLDVTFGSVSPFDLLAFGLACIAFHLAYPIPFNKRR